MAKYRSHLPQLGDKPFLTDSGLETTLIFHEGVELPHMASITLHASAEGEQRLRDYFVRHIEIARARNAGFVLESASWRASPDWGAKLGLSRAQLVDLNRRSIALLAALLAPFTLGAGPVVAVSYVPYFLFAGFVSRNWRAPRALLFTGIAIAIAAYGASLPEGEAASPSLMPSSTAARWDSPR